MCVARAGGAKRTSSNPNTTLPGLGVDLLRMDGAALAASPVRVVDRIVTPPFMKAAGNWASPREFGRPGRKGPKDLHRGGAEVRRQPALNERAAAPLKLISDGLVGRAVATRLPGYLRVSASPR